MYYASSAGAHASFTMLGGGVRGNSVSMEANGFGGAHLVHALATSAGRCIVATTCTQRLQ